MPALHFSGIWVSAEVLPKLYYNYFIGFISLFCPQLSGDPVVKRGRRVYDKDDDGNRGNGARTVRSSYRMYEESFMKRKNFLCPVKDRQIGV